MGLSRLLAAIILAMLTVSSVWAQEAVAPPALGLPLRCVPAADCWIANHVDLDPGPQARDYACGQLTYDGHNGTDFALRDLAAMKEGVPVLAAAAGKVRAIRDGEPDVSVRERGKEAIKGRECGNGVVIDHGGGWQTQYCHLRRDSIAVRTGGSVAAGDQLGLVGLSGETEYPHLHLTVRYNKQVADPFRGLAPAAACGVGEATLWDRQMLAALPYAPGAIYNFGVAAEMPQSEAVREGAYRSRIIVPEARLFAVWVEVFGVEAGDEIEIRMDAPDGTPFIRHRALQEKRMARVYRVAARKRGAAPWLRGIYHGRISVFRKNQRDGAASVAELVAEVR